jgi:RNA polymerase sigma factor (sigma-70 family)
MTVDARTDGELVEAYLAGDSAALAALYDRFAGGLFDTARAMLGNSDDAADVVQDVFCVAAAKLGQLRDRNRVKPWLYAIARHEVFRRTKRRRREAPVLDAAGEGSWDLPAVADPRADGAAVESAELAAVVRAAAGGLEVHDQLILELNVRQGLAGEDLASALGVTLAQSHSMLFRMRERVERAIGAYVVTRGDRRDCPELAIVLAGWDGTFDALWRKRIARHIDGCDTCAERRRIAIGLVALAPAFAAPAWLRQRTLRAAAVGSSGPARYRFDGRGFPVSRRRGAPFGARAAVAAVVAAVLGLAIALPLLGRDDPDIVASIGAGTTTTDVATTEATSTTSTNSSTSSSSTSTSSTSPTTSTTTPSVAPPPQPPQQPPPQQPPSPPTSPSTVVPPPPPPTTTTTPPTTTTRPPTTTTTTTTAPTPPPNQPPRVSRAAVSPSTWPACRPPRSVAVRAVATDEGSIQSVSASWSGPGGSGSASMSGSTTYSGSFSVSQHVPGSYAVTITARDDDGATASASTSFSIAPC